MKSLEREFGAAAKGIAPDVMAKRFELAMKSKA